MAWCRTGDKPLFEPMMAYVTNIYAALSLNELTSKFSLLSIILNKFENNTMAILNMANWIFIHFGS